MTVKALLTLLLLLLSFFLGAPQRDRGTPNLQVYFSPDQDLTWPIVAEILKAESHVYVATYYFDVRPIAEALGVAGRRLENVKVLIDEHQGQEIPNFDRELDDSNVVLKLYHIDDVWKMHNKFIVIDNKTVITGSANLSESGMTKNQENIIILEDEKTAEIYAQKFLEMWSEL